MSRKSPVVCPKWGNSYAIWFWDGANRMYRPTMAFTDALQDARFQRFVADAAAKAPARRTEHECRALEIAMKSAQ